jgi:hypothetical protein
LRNPDGSLFPTAGRLSVLDAFIAEAGHVIDAAVVDKLKTAAGLLTSSDEKANAKTYIAIAEKVVAKGAAYVDGELKRLAGFLANPSVQPDSKTNFSLKTNILKAFQK